MSEPKKISNSDVGPREAVLVRDTALSKYLKAGMYLLSLWLLFVIIFVAKINVEICFASRVANRSELASIAYANALPIACVLILLVSFAFYARFRFIIRGAKDGPVRLLGLEDRNSEHLVFLATYVVPLVGFGLDTVRQVINLSITLVVIGAIYVRTNMFYANPTLSLLGFKLFNATLADGPAILISTEDLIKGESVNLQRLDKRIFFARKAMKVRPDEDS